MSATPSAAERLNFRLEPQKKRLIEQAAAIRGLSLTDFAVTTLFREAQEVLSSEQSLVLSDRDRDAFLAALDRPPAPNAKALRAAKRYKDARSKGSLR
jgi:uncharacterized protein (DUF1778 family)